MNSFVPTLSLIALSVLLGSCSSPTPPQTTEMEETSTEKKRVVFLGDSLTAGYGIDPNDAYPALLQEKASQVGLPYEMVNAGKSGDTTSSGVTRLSWVLKASFEVLVLELGANDGLRGIPLPEIKKNLIDIIEQSRQINPEAEILLMEMKMPPNYGRVYTQGFNEIFHAVSKETGVRLIPFFLKDVAGEPEKNLPDGIHPNEKGHQTIAKNIWPAIEPVLRSRSNR